MVWLTWLTKVPIPQPIMQASPVAEINADSQAVPLSRLLLLAMMCGLEEPSHVVGSHRGLLDMVISEKGVE